MAYKLSQLAPGSYDVVLNGVIIASLVRSGHTREPTWTAELLGRRAAGGQACSLYWTGTYIRQLRGSSEVAWMH